MRISEAAAAVPEPSHNSMVRRMAPMFRQHVWQDVPLMDDEWHADAFHTVTNGDKEKLGGRKKAAACIFN
jgi:hypothetical protein